MVIKHNLKFVCLSSKEQEVKTEEERAKRIKKQINSLDKFIKNFNDLHD